MSQDSLIAELLEENEVLRQRLTEERLGVYEISSASKLTYEELRDKLKIAGILLAPGIWNGVLYSVQEIKKMFDKFKDRLSKLPIKVEHGNDPEFGDTNVGYLTKVKWDETLKAILYEGEVVHPKAIKEVKAGRFSSTSLKSQMIKILQGGIEKGIDIVPIDNSLTETPACPPCKITFYQELSEGSQKLEYYGIEELQESQNLLRDLEDGEDDMNEEEFEIEEESVLVLPEEYMELSDEEEEIELEVLPLAQALKEKRVIYKYLPPGKYPRRRRRVKRRKGYYYYPYYPYYYPPYYPYYGYPYYGYYGKPLSEEDEEEWETLTEYIIRKNKRTGKYVVFKSTGKKGFGAFKIVKQFDTLEEARAWIKKQGGQSTEEKAKVKCPVCDQEFDTKEEMIEHFNKEHSEQYGKYGEGKYPKAKGKEAGSEMSSEELRRKRCPFCHELVDDLEEHWKSCPVYAETVENVIKCKFCGETFRTKKELIAHLKECEPYLKKYGKTEEKSLTEEESSETAEQGSETEGKETGQEAEEETEEKEEEEEETPDEGTTEEETPVTIADIIEQVGTDLDLIAQLLIEAEKRSGKWE